MLIYPFGEASYAAQYVAEIPAIVVATERVSWLPASDVAELNFVLISDCYQSVQINQK